jgi:hypothetical protein
MTLPLTVENLKKLIEKKEELQISIEYLVHLKNYPKSMAVLSRDTLKSLSDEAEDGWVDMHSIWKVFDTHRVDFSPEAMSEAITMLQKKLERVAFVLTAICDGRQRFEADLLD